MKRAACALLLILTFVACDPGPMPEVPSHKLDEQFDYTKYWFPTDSEHRLPLDRAIEGADAAEVRRLLDGGANPNLRWGKSGDHFPLQEALELAGRGNHLSDASAIASLLLKQGADPNARWCLSGTREPSEWRSICTAERAMTPLLYAAFAGYRDVVELLLAAGADPRARDFSGRSALDYATDEIVFEMISAALFPDLATRDHDALEWLKRAGGDSYDPSRSRTPLLRALEFDDSGFFVFGTGAGDEDRLLSRVRILMRIGADPNERLTERAPLSYALAHGHLRVARVLLQNGANVNQRWCERFPSGRIAPGYAPKHLIVGPGEPRSDPACDLTNGITPLMWSAGAADRDAVGLLLEFKADRSLIDWAGRSALHYAVWRDVWDLLKAP